MPLQEFYSAVAQLSLTLFGVWMIVLEVGPEKLLDDPVLKRTAYHVSLGFLIPGVVSLASLLAVEALVLWRVVFGIGGVLGVWATARMAAASPTGPVPRATWWLSAVLYAGFALVALLKPSFHVGDTTISALTQEGTLITAQLLVGASAAWRVLAMPRHGT